MSTQFVSNIKFTKIALYFNTKKLSLKINKKQSNIKITQQNFPTKPRAEISNSSSKIQTSHLIITLVVIIIKKKSYKSDPKPLQQAAVVHVRPGRTDRRCPVGALQLDRIRLRLRRRQGDCIRSQREQVPADLQPSGRQQETWQAQSAGLQSHPAVRYHRRRQVHGFLFLLFARIRNC